MYIHSCKNNKESITVSFAKENLSLCSMRFKRKCKWTNDVSTTGQKLHLVAHTEKTKKKNK